MFNHELLGVECNLNVHFSFLSTFSVNICRYRNCIVYILYIGSNYNMHFPQKNHIWFAPNIHFPKKVKEREIEKKV